MTTDRTRQDLLESAFAEIPQEIAGRQLRPLSAGSFMLLGRIGNPMVADQAAPEAGDANTRMFQAVVEYVWIHSAYLDDVRQVVTRDDLPEKPLADLAWEISMAEAMEFLQSFLAQAQRMAAGIAEPQEEENTEPGKPPTPPAGSPPSPTPSDAPETPPASDTSSGKPPSNESSPTSTPPTSPPEPAAGGPSPIPPPVRS